MPNKPAYMRACRMYQNRKQNVRLAALVPKETTGLAFHAFYLLAR